MMCLYSTLPFRSSPTTLAKLSKSTTQCEFVSTLDFHFTFSTLAHSTALPFQRAFICSLMSAVQHWHMNLCKDTCAFAASGRLAYKITQTYLQRASCVFRRGLWNASVCRNADANLLVYQADSRARSAANLEETPLWSKKQYIYSSEW